MTLTQDEMCMMYLSISEIRNTAKYYGVRIGDRTLLNIIKDIIVARNNNVPAFQYKEKA